MKKAVQKFMKSAQMEEMLATLPAVKAVKGLKPGEMAKAIHLLHLEDGDSLGKEVKAKKTVFLIVKGCLMAVNRSIDPYDEPDGRDYNMLHADEMSAPIKTLSNLVANGDSFVMAFNEKFYLKKMQNKPLLLHQVIRAVARKYDELAEEHK